MSPFNFEDLRAPLVAAALAAAVDKPLDAEWIAFETGTSTARIHERLAYLADTGLLLLESPEIGRPLMVTRAGTQYLARRGRVSEATLTFLPEVIDDLYSRWALREAGTELVDGLREAALAGGLVDLVAAVVPPAFACVVDPPLAHDLYVAAVALMCRLSAGLPAACVAEEIMAVELIGLARDRLGDEVGSGRLDEDDAAVAVRELSAIFRLFGAKDVLDLFRMREPADAALALHSRAHRRLGVADQRPESWLVPFGGVVATGHLRR